MKLVTAIVHNEDASTLVDALLEKEYRATRFNSSGGFLKQGNATILVGVEEDQVDGFLGPAPQFPVGDAYEASAFRTILFTDIVGSTEKVAESSDSEEALV